MEISLKLRELIICHPSDDPEDYLEKVMEADKNIFPDSNELIAYFNDLMRFYICSTKKLPILLIGIDEIAKAKAQIQVQYFKNLGLLFTQLRDILNYTLFVFISTTADWTNYDKILSDNTDLQGQIAAFMKKMPLMQLEIPKYETIFSSICNGRWIFKFKALPCVFHTFLNRR